MKRFIIALLILAFAIPAFAQDGIGNVKGKMLVGGFLDYAIGFGDVFKDYEFTVEDVTVKEETSLGLSFGGKFFFGLAQKIMIGVVVDYQTIKYKGSVEGDLGGFEDLFSYDETENWISFNGNVLVLFSPEKKLCPYVEAGPGYYMPSHEEADGEIGVNAGLGLIYMMSPTMAIDLGARGHMIFTEGESTTYVEAHGGIVLFFGGATR